MGLECSGVFQHPSSFWSVTQSLLGVYQATISHVKEDSNTFHMRHGSMIFTKWIQKYDSSLTFNNLCLVRSNGHIA